LNAKPQQVIVAQIASIQHGMIILKVTPPTAGKPGGEFPLKTNDSTVVTVDGEKKSLSDLTAGMGVKKITFAPEGETATAIVVGEKNAATAPAK
jgi:hypothetical protein